MRRHRGLFACAPCFLLLGALPAAADTIAYTGVSPAIVVNLAVGGTNISEASYAGLLSMTDTPNGGTSQVFTGYCLDIYHSFGSGASWSATPGGSFNPDTTNPAITGTAMSHDLAWLYNSYSASASVSNDAAAGLQLALWAFEYSDGKYTITTHDGIETGTFVNTITGKTITLTNSSGYNSEADFDTALANANADITALMAASPGTISSQTATFYLVNGRLQGNSTSSQDLIGSHVSSSTPNAIPEPSSFLLVTAGLGAVGFGAVRVRQVRTA